MFIFIIACLVIGAIILGVVNYMADIRERDRIMEKFEKNRAINKERQDINCKNGIHWCNGSRTCVNCGTVLYEDEKNYYRCWWRGRPPYHGHEVCDNCQNCKIR